MKQLKDALPVVEAGKNVTVTTTTGANGNPIYTINATSSKGSGIEVHSKQVGDNFINGQGSTVSVTNNGDIKVDSPMAYIGNKNPNDTSTATNTVELVGKDNQKDTVQITKVASGLRKPDENMEVGSKLSAQDLAQSLNLASGETLNHAVNVGDLQGVSNNLNNSITNLSNQIGDINQRLGDVSNHANAGISSAMAMASLPQAYLPGKSMLAGGMASYNGQGAVAIGISKLSDNGRWVIKINGTADSQGNAGGAVGAGFHW